MGKNYMVTFYREGKFSDQYGPYYLEDALWFAHIFDGAKYHQAKVWDFDTGEIVYKSILADD